MDKFLYYNNLFSLYQKLLTPKERLIFSLYYEENLSMGEIADIKGISRSAVGKTIKIVTTKLDNYEENLGIYKQREEIIKIKDSTKDDNTRILLEKLL